MQRAMYYAYVAVSAELNCQVQSLNCAISFANYYKKVDINIKTLTVYKLGREEQIFSVNAICHADFNLQLTSTM